MKRVFNNSPFSIIARHGAIPISLYLLLFCLLTYPLILDFNTRFFTDAGDGLQNVWNIWWINTAVSQPGIHPSIWHTDLLHFPFGTTLYGQTLNPFNGLTAIALLRFLSLTHSFNTLVIFAFVMGGVTSYWLAYHLTRSFWGSIIAGYIFTFSSYHFAHYYGHMQLISLQWIPLFLLFWILLLDRPTILLALASSLSLYLVLLCDYYYFFYCILSGGLILLWRMIERRDIRFIFQRDYLISLSSFIFLALASAGQIVLPLMRLSRIDPFMDAHKPINFSLDLLALFIPGEAWKFSTWTEPYWSKLPLGLSEASVYLGYAVIILLFYLWLKRSTVLFADSSKVTLWYLLLAFFFLMALGPALQVGGKVIYDGIMPYTILETLLPFLKLSGVPVRMVVMVTLAASMLCALALRELIANFPKNRFLVFALLALLVFETVPGQLPSTSTDVPSYARALADLPDDGGVLDLAASTRYLQLYYQTAHHKPLAFGYVSRLPSSVAEKETGLNRAVNRQDYTKLWDSYHIRYLVTGDVIEYKNQYVSVELVYQDGSTNIYRIECKCKK
ncbi:MAG TPA: hypothetical protein DCX53_01710 [Anaerolineae bacterium]|nr:hypothetical protein [Anaerolineae bacterium]